jgi:hypothetical protein
MGSVNPKRQQCSAVLEAPPPAQRATVHGHTATRPHGQQRERPALAYTQYRRHASLGRGRAGGGGGLDLHTALGKLQVAASPSGGCRRRMLARLPRTRRLMLRPRWFPRASLYYACLSPTQGRCPGLAAYSSHHGDRLRCCCAVISPCPLRCTPLSLIRTAPPFLGRPPSPGALSAFTFAASRFPHEVVALICPPLATRFPSPAVQPVEPGPSLRSALPPPYSDTLLQLQVVPNCLRVQTTLFSPWSLQRCCCSALSSPSAPRCSYCSRKEGAKCFGTDFTGSADGSLVQKPLPGPYHRRRKTTAQRRITQTCTPHPARSHWWTCLVSPRSWARAREPWYYLLERENACRSALSFTMRRRQCALHVTSRWKTSKHSETFQTMLRSVASLSLSLTMTSTSRRPSQDHIDLSGGRTTRQCVSRV